MAVADTHRRRWSRFRVRFLLLLVLLLVAIIGIALGWKANRVRNQRNVVAAMNELEAQVTYDYQELHQAEPPGPKWLRNIVGDDFFAEVVHIQIVNDRAPDDIVAKIAKLPNLRGLFLNSDGLTDNGLDHLSRSKTIDSLGFGSSTVTDVGLGHLKKMAQLKELSIARAEITDAGLVHLHGMRRLSWMQLSYCPQVTKHGVEQIRAALPTCDVVSN
jgi:hypothetical protein